MATTPDYQRIADHIGAKIAAGILKPGDRLPTYRQLADEYGVGVSTIRNAMVVLRERAQVTGHPGKATYVADPENS